MDHVANDKSRIDALEKALQECVTYLRALPPHPQSYHAANAAQAVLDAQSLAQPAFAREIFRQDGMDPFVFNAVLAPRADEVELNVNGDFDKHLSGLKLLFKLGVRLRFYQDQERAQQYFADEKSRRKA